VVVVVVVLATSTVAEALVERVLLVVELAQY
jgi:hypothetical protein